MLKVLLFMFLLLPLQITVRFKELVGGRSWRLSFSLCLLLPPLRHSCHACVWLLVHAKPVLSPLLACFALSLSLSFFYFVCCSYRNQAIIDANVCQFKHMALSCQHLVLWFPGIAGNKSAEWMDGCYPHSEGNVSASLRHKQQFRRNVGQLLTK